MQRGGLRGVGGSSTLVKATEADAGVVIRFLGTKGSSWSLFSLLPPLHWPGLTAGTPALCASLEARFFALVKKENSPVRIHKVVFSAPKPTIGMQIYARTSFFNYSEKSCRRPASTVAHAAFQDLLSCGQRPRSQPPGTLTSTRRPAARHSEHWQPITTPAMPLRQRRLHI